MNIEGQLAASRWRSKFGRPSKVPRLGDVDPTGSYCPVPEDWLKRKCGMSGYFQFCFCLNYCMTNIVQISLLHAIRLTMGNNLLN